MIKIFRQWLTVVFVGVFVSAFLSACARYESDLNRLMDYDFANRIRLFLPVEEMYKDQYSPRYIEIKYVDQERVLKELDAERKLQLIRYLANSWNLELPDAMEKIVKTPLKKADETEESYKNRLFSVIPDVKSERKAYRTKEEMQREVWDLFRTEDIGKNTGNKDFLLWVTYWGADLTQNDRIEFSIDSYALSRKLKMESLLIKEGGTSDIFTMEIESMALLYKKEYLVICKNFKPEPRTHYTLQIKGQYLAKLRYVFDKNQPSELKEGEPKERWWKINRQLEFYFDTKGYCHFENDQSLSDEPLNTTLNFHLIKPRKVRTD